MKKTFIVKVFDGDKIKKSLINRGIGTEQEIIDTNEKSIANGFPTLEMFSLMSKKDQAKWIKKMQKANNEEN